MTRKECHEDGYADKERHNRSCELAKYLMRKHVCCRDNQSSHYDTTSSQAVRVRYQCITNQMRPILPFYVRLCRPMN